MNIPRKEDVKMRVKPETFLVETEKALQIIMRKVKEQTNEMSPATKLKVLNELSKGAQDFYQHEEFQKEKALVEFEISRGGTKKFVPDDVREKIEANLEIEMAALHKVTAEKYAELEKHLKQIEKLLQSEVTPLLDEINALHNRELSVSNITRYLDATYGYTIGDQLVTHFLLGAFESYAGVKTKKFTQTVKTFTSEMKEVKYK